MNVIDLISTVEDILIEGQLPIIKTKSLVNLDELLDILDEMKRQLPQELQAANHLRAEKNKLIIEAQQEAQRLLDDVEKQASKMVDQSDITKNAYIKSRQILQEAKDEVDALKVGTYDYLTSKMDEISNNLININEEMEASKNELYEYLVTEDSGEIALESSDPKLMNDTQNTVTQLKSGTYEYLAHKMDELAAKNIRICEELAESKAEFANFMEELNAVTLAEETEEDYEE